MIPEISERKWIRPADMPDDIAADIEVIHYQIEHSQWPRYWRDRLAEAWGRYDLESRSQAREA